MPVSAYILTAAAFHLTVFVSYPHTGRFGFPFLAVSLILWTSFAFYLRNSLTNTGRTWKAAIAAGYALMCAFSALAFLPQKDAVSPLRKFSSGQYPDGKTLYLGLRRLGVDAPGLLPPQKEEPLP
ncbi:MAG: hypothetical protein HY550_10245 [Elusimicrobia bacterium]|nr:hypothetical protein [Elusimicrobiota bacterium]